MLNENQEQGFGAYPYGTKRDSGDDELKEEYDQKGFNESSEELLTNYKNALNLFEAEFEI